MSATASRKSFDVLGWKNVFTENATQNNTNSMTFMKQLTVIAVNTILHGKNVYHHDNYTLKSFANIKIPILKRNCKDEDAQFLSSTLTKAFDAFDKKYLDKLVLCLYEGNCTKRNLVEYHLFEYNYKSGESTITIHSKDKERVRHTSCSLEYVREQTLQLLRSCITFIHSTSNLPIENCGIGVRLYYNDDAPEDYQAPGYTDKNEEDYVLPYIRDAVILGRVETPHHTMIAHSFSRDTLAASNEAIPSQKAPHLTCDIDSTGTDESGSEWRLTCPCKTNDAPRTLQLLTCQYCKNKQHAVCFGISAEMAPNVKHHCCTQCYDSDKTRTPTDAELANADTKRRFTLSLFRRALTNCMDMSTIGSDDFGSMFNLNENAALRLMQAFFSYGIIEKQPTPKLRQKIIKDKLQQAMAKNVKTDINMHQRIYRSFSSQDTLLISKILSPLQQINIDNASVIAKPTEKSAQKESMSEYIDVISESADFTPPKKELIKRTRENKGFSLIKRRKK